jgi:hypothetical protein
LNSDDNSGIIKYVSIRHGGAEIGEGNEINGLTLAGVGSNTTIHHIEVIGNVDDGVEFFGGTVNVSELLVWGQGDDGIDIDQGYSGTISNSMVILNEASDHAFEIDGPEGSLNGSFTIENSTIIGAYYGCSATGVDGEMADFRKGAMGITNNILSINFADGKDVVGKVIDEEFNETMPFANVLVKGTNIGVTTDFDGNYSINVDPGTYTLVFSFVGYRTKEGNWY